MSLEIVRTNDGSDSLWSERYRQHYHNRHGAETEGRHVFFEQTGLSAALARHEALDVLEIGFGSGSHALMHFEEHQRCESRSRVRFCSVEHDPVDPAILEQMYNTERFACLAFVRENLLALAAELHCSGSGAVIWRTCGPHITWEVFRGPFEKMPLTFCKADYVLFDAFLPKPIPSYGRRPSLKS